MTDVSAVTRHWRSEAMRLRRCANCARYNWDEGNYIEHYAACKTAHGRDACHYEPSRWQYDGGPKAR